MSVKELISFSDFSVLTSKIPLLENDFVKCQDLVQIKQRYPFLFRYSDGKWRSSLIGESIGKEFKSYAKLNTITLKIVLGNTVVNIKKETEKSCECVDESLAKPKIHKSIKKMP